MPEAAAARVQHSRLREALLAALADWERVSLDEEERQCVAQVYRLALPPDASRARLEEAIGRHDNASLAKLTQEPAFQNLPPTTLVFRALDLTKCKEWVAAEQLLRAGLERRPGDFWLNHNLGYLFLIQQPPRLEEAVRYLMIAVALRPDNPGVHLNLGHALYDKGDVDSAIRCFQAALRISPTYVTAHVMLGRAMQAKGRLDEALPSTARPSASRRIYPRPTEILATP